MHWSAIPLYELHREFVDFALTQCTFLSSQCTFLRRARLVRGSEAGDRKAASDQGGASSEVATYRRPEPGGDSRRAVNPHGPGTRARGVRHSRIRPRQRSDRSSGPWRSGGAERLRVENASDTP